ncbi:MAG: ABC transporter ATP-binding protein [Pseudonocardiaceae bacterium]
MSELRFEDVHVTFGSRRTGLRAVDGVTLTVPSGQVVGLVGESGSGKSTLARAAVGLAPLAGGRITLDDVDLTMSSRRDRPLQMAFQDPYASLDPRMSIGESIAEAMPRAAIPRGADRRREVARLLELVHLDADRAGDLPARFSGGQRQRIALARALAGQPRVLLADEITSALDVSVQGAVLNLLREIQRELRLSMLFISHNLSVVRYISDQIAVMYLGRVVESGPTDRVLTDPQHPYTRDLLAAVPSPGVRLLDEDDVPAAVADAEPADPHHRPAGCSYHSRCPIGPLVEPSRGACLTTDPVSLPTEGQHSAACHFAGAGHLLPAGR